MARQGRFGHLPAAAPDLSATIVAMMEAYENQRDRNIQTAWEQGGQFEGGKVTDERYLQFIQSRMRETSRDDPMYDYWQQTLFAIRFRVHEEKANLQYQRENWDEGDMANFYRQEAQKVPRHSSAWRDLMTSAARFAKADKAKRAASAAAAKAEAFRRRWEGADKRWIAPARVVDNALTRLAQRNGWITKGQTFWSLNMGAGEVLSFNDALGQLEATPGWEEVRRYLEQNDPHFHGRLSMEYVTNTYERAKHGGRIQKRAAKDIGYSSYVEAAEKTIDGYESQANKSETWDMSVSYANARNTWQEVIDDPTSTAAERAAADATFANKLTRFERQADKAGDIVAAGKMLNERRALAGDTENVGDDPLYVEDWTGYATGSSATGKDIATRKERDIEDLENLTTGASMQVWGKDAQGNTVPMIVPAKDAPNVYGVEGAVALVRSTKPSTMTTPDGKTISVPAATYTEYRQRVPIYVRVPNPLFVDPLTGDYSQMDLINPAPNQGEQVGWMITDPITGETSWQMFTSEGTRFTPLDPFAQGAVKRQYMEQGSWIVIADPDFSVAGGAVYTEPDPNNPGEMITRANPRALLRPELNRGAEPGTPGEEAGPTGPGGLTEEEGGLGSRTWYARRESLIRQISEEQGTGLGEPPPGGGEAELPTAFGEQPPAPEPGAPSARLQELRRQLAELEAAGPQIALDRERAGEVRAQQFTRADELRNLIAMRTREGLGDQPETVAAREELTRLAGQTQGVSTANVGVFNPLVRQLAVYQQLGVRPAGLPVTDEPSRLAQTVNEVEGYSTFTTFYWAQDQQHRREFLLMDPAAVVRTLQTQDPDLIANPAKLETALREVDQIRAGALQGEAQFMAQNFLQPYSGILGQGTIDVLASKVGRIAPTSVVTALLRQSGVPVADAGTRAAAEVRATLPPDTAPPAWLAPTSILGSRDGGGPTGEIIAPEPPVVPPTPPGAAGSTEIAGQLAADQRQRQARQVSDTGPRVAPRGRAAVVRPGVRRIIRPPKVKIPDPPPIARLPPIAWGNTPSAQQQRRQEEERAQRVRQRGGGPIAS